MSAAIKPAPIISFPASGVPQTRVIVRTACTFLAGWPRVVVRRGEGQATRIRIYRRNWT